MHFQSSSTFNEWLLVGGLTTVYSNTGAPVHGMGRDSGREGKESLEGVSIEPTRVTMTAICIRGTAQYAKQVCQGDQCGNRVQTTFLCASVNFQVCLMRFTDTCVHAWDDEGLIREVAANVIKCHLKFDSMPLHHFIIYFPVCLEAMGSCFHV